jgi:hypothetical protein
MQDMADADIVQAYGSGEPHFGGLYFDEDVLVALFTNDLEAHRAALVPRLRAPGQLRVARAARSYSAVEAANRWVQGKLMMSKYPHPEVFGVGIGVQDGQFVVIVSVENLTAELGEVIRLSARPDEVVLHAGSRPRRL